MLVCLMLCYVMEELEKRESKGGTLSGVLEWGKREWREGKGKGLSSNFGLKFPFELSHKTSWIR